MTCSTELAMLSHKLKEDCGTSECSRAAKAASKSMDRLARAFDDELRVLEAEGEHI